MPRNALISLIFLSMIAYLAKCDDYVEVLRNTMPAYMKDKAIALIGNGFAYQMDLALISTNLTAEFNNAFGAEWFSIIGPSGFVAKFNAAQQTLLWLQYNELEIILYKPLQADDLAVIKSARVGQFTYQYIHSTVNATIQAAIKDIANEVIAAQNSYRTIQTYLRMSLDAKLGGYWLVIVTSAAPNYDSNWDSGFNLNYAMEFDVGSLRVFVYQKL